MIMSISLWHSGKMQGINGGLPPALSEAGQCRPTWRFENKESRAGEWESEVEVASTMFQIPQRSLA
jgi:hypothetical protein